MMYWEQAATLTDTAVSDELFAGPWNTATLVSQLASEISVYTDNPRRIAFMDEWNGGQGSLCRGDICRMLADRGITLSRINFRKS
jgi:hypothetical protein